MRYYSTQRPITPGSFPNYYNRAWNKVTEIVNFDCKTFCEEIGQDAWGYIDYQRPIPMEDAANYELIPPPAKIKKVVFAGTDGWGREVYEDEDGKLWKYTDPGEMPRERHELLHSSTENELDGEPCWPMSSDMDYLIVEEL